MADIMQDVLNLNYSPSFDIQGMQEADINLSLSPSVAASATVYGTVTDGTNPLPNATVKLFDSLGVPYRHVMTDVAGAYSFDNVPAGTYSIAAALDGYIMSPSSLLTLSSGSSIEVPLVCRSEAALALGAIAGTATTIGLAGSAPVCRCHRDPAQSGRDSRTYNGTVSGIIRDSNGAPVSGPAFFKSGRNLEVQGGK